MAATINPDQYLQVYTEDDRCGLIRVNVRVGDIDLIETVEHQIVFHLSSRRPGMPMRLLRPVVAEFDNDAEAAEFLDEHPFLKDLVEGAGE